MSRRRFAAGAASTRTDSAHAGPAAEQARQDSTAVQEPTSGDVSAGRSFAVHIHGPWGSGKTSVLNFMRGALQGGELGNQWVVIDFNAWQHQRLRPPWWTLVRRVYEGAREELEARGDRRRLCRLRWRWLVWRLRADWLPVALAVAIIMLVLLLVGGVFDGAGAGLATTAQPAASGDLASAAGGGTGVNGSAARATADPGKVAQTAITVLTGLLTIWFGILAFGRSMLFGSAKAAESYMDVSRDPMRPIARLFERLVDSVGRPVAIFIDDLDRCDSDYVVDLIEGIQTLFRRAHVTYVITADRNWIRSSFEQRYEPFKPDIGEPGRPLGYLFLEKLFQISASLPQMSQEATVRFWGHLLNVSRKEGEPSAEAGEALGEEGERVETAADAEAARRVQAAERRAEAILDQFAAQTPEEMQQVIDEHDADPVQQQGLRAAAAKLISSNVWEQRTAHFLQPFSDLLERNPRAMKRLVNAYGIRQAVNFLEGRKVDPSVLAIWTIVEMRWPQLADCLSEHPALVAKIGQKTPPKDVRIPEALRSLFTSETVSEVATGKGLGENTRLTADGIKEIVGLYTVTAGSGAR